MLKTIQDGSLKYWKVSASTGSLNIRKNVGII